MTDPTYRERPEDTEYVTAQEVPYCAWCRWSHDIPLHCRHPRLTPAHQTLRCEAYNTFNQPCPLYEPSTYTRLVRCIGLRKPVKR